MNVKKLILLLITILIPITGSVLIGVYSYNRYNPEVYTDLETEFKSDYVAGAITTESRIDLYRELENYYYEKDPIYTKKVELDGEEVFSLSIYRSFSVVYDKDTEQSSYEVKYEVYFYNVNYTKLKDEFKKDFSDDPSVVDKYSDTYFEVGIYPTAEMNEDENILDETSGASISGSTSIAMYDYNSVPELNGEKPYRVQIVTFKERNLTSALKKLFDGENAYITVDAKISRTIDGEDPYYSTLENLVEEKVSGFKVYAADFDVENTATIFEGHRETGVRETLNNAGYNRWLFKHYIWWQSLIALVIFSIIMAGFYFAFTYEEPQKPRNTSRKKK